MSILRLQDQKITEPYPGVSQRVPAGAATGATQLRAFDTVIQPGASIPYHVHGNTEATYFVVDGDLSAVVDDHRVDMHPGDLVMAPPGTGHGFTNSSEGEARIVTMIPHTDADVSHLDPGDPATGELPPNIAPRSSIEAWTPWERCTRYDMMNHERGALSTAFSELIFEPGSMAPPHFHPETEEAMYCIDGALVAMYGGEEIPLAPGDMFVAEPGVRHTVFNASDEAAILLPLHPTVVPVRELVDWSPVTPLPA
ncbi:MAG: cupin domain-containing protein [Dehalococcoidia bacterium]|jgi:quercetin dioxygenase-like cupin family protein|nr:cupin domain-containing protein [Dehalococcoidia bacterium]